MNFKLPQNKRKIPKNIDWNDTVPFVPPITKGRVIKVYDGDTITIAARLPHPKSPLYRF
jgi:endonuclease YncB( thermonuclease family)